MNDWRSAFNMDAHNVDNYKQTLVCTFGTMPFPTVSSSQGQYVQFRLRLIVHFIISIAQ